jgi:hypothetical protein
MSYFFDSMRVKTQNVVGASGCNTLSIENPNLFRYEHKT